jgi:hypothetical protein
MYIQDLFNPNQKKKLKGNKLVDNSKNLNSVLNEPNPHDIKMLNKWNKTVEELFIESTFKLNVEFQLHMTWWLYNNNGWVKHNCRLLEGNKNVQKVCVKVHNNIFPFKGTKS